MMGTLATVLAGKKVPTFGDRFRADVEGDIEDVDGVLRITRIGCGIEGARGKNGGRPRGDGDVYCPVPRGDERARVHRHRGHVGRFGTGGVMDRIEEIFRNDRLIRDFGMKPSRGGKGTRRCRSSSWTGS